MRLLATQLYILHDNRIIEDNSNNNFSILCTKNLLFATDARRLTYSLHNQVKTCFTTVSAVYII